jgi:preprotein translocase subunit YajC
VSIDSFTVLLLLQQAQRPPEWIQFVPIVLIFVIFYFLLIAPARKRQKALERTIANLKKGDRVITNGGIYGEVAAVESGFLILKVADSVKLKVAKSAVAGLETDQDAEKKS